LGFVPDLGAIVCQAALVTLAQALYLIVSVGPGFRQFPSAKTWWIRPTMDEHGVSKWDMMGFSGATITNKIPTISR